MESHMSSKTEGTPDYDVLKRPWSELPLELLSLIADRLGLIELLGFRGVCKAWRTAASTASAQTESEEGEPSFLAWGADEKCTFYYQRSKKTYPISIPELDNAICLSSYYGWLLLAQPQERSSSLFFFCPFSRSRIELPEFPHSDISDHVATFSAPPTSPDCILVVAHRINNSETELHQLHRGASTWTRQQYNNQMGTLTGALYIDENQSFYFVDNSGRGILKFSTTEQEAKSYRLTIEAAPGTETLPFIRTLNFAYRIMKKIMGLQGDTSVSFSTCGTNFLRGKYVVLIENDKIKPPSPEAPDGSAKIPQLKGIWIHPRLHQIPPNQRW